MNAIELANQLDHESDLGEFKHYEAAAMLRKQDAAIKQLRMACQDLSSYVRDEQVSTDGTVNYSTTQVNRLAFKARAALAATEEFNAQ